MIDAAETVRELGCEPLRALKTRPDLAVWHVRRGTRELVLKLWAEDSPQAQHAVRSHRLLPTLGGVHRRLVVPEFVDDGRLAGLGPYVLMSFIPGRDYRARWHYTKPALAGGAALAARDIDVAVELLGDLRRIETAALIDRGLAVHTPLKELRLFERRLAALARDGLVSNAFAAAVRPIATRWADSVDPAGALTVSNTDFRFLNFLDLDNGRTAVVDWDDARCSRFETEHCVAYQWLFLWRRPDLQAQLLADARDVLAAGEPLWPLIAIRAIIQASTCRGNDGLVALHLEQAEHAVAETSKRTCAMAG